MFGTRLSRDSAGAGALSQPGMALDRITLTDFRNHRATRLDGAAQFLRVCVAGLGHVAFEAQVHRGHGGGRAAATVLGVLGGAILGDKVEGAPAPEVRTVQNCTNQVFYENRTTGYHVVYEFAGKQYTVQMPNDPGPTVRLQVTPVAPPPVPMGGGVPPVGSAPRY